MDKPLLILVLAAGLSRRMGRPKQLLPIGGETLLRYVVKKALTVPHASVAVVGSGESLMKQQCEDLPVVWIENRDAHDGMSTSIKAGISYAQDCSAGSVMILLGDQPGMDPGVLAGMAGAFGAGSSGMLQARYEGKPGHPVMFDRRFFPELLKLEGDTGAKPLLQRHADSLQFWDVNTPVPVDLDTPEEYEHYIRSSEE
ncbi:nucleotidyltransferase family protein [Paenibacillus lemnae]|uniref:Nucleotidyltransferase family protein n=1 Tax=Paenibacillus lemnae TaxID=1330551 RepID=A0A848M862_PAELE|nr:nucleotidyltransferase family protein [Paenibacillus lemnae]NMO96390.1 nucleotidyltransferase family protein [Paenibacillus lemnae]